MKKIKPEKKEEEIVRSFSDLLRIIKSNKLFLILSILFTLIIYANIITGDFVNLDDLSKALIQPQFQDIMVSVKNRDAYGIIATIIFKIFGINSSAFHVAAIVFHMINGIFVFLLFYILFGKKVAMISTLMFLAHPVNTETVSWHAGIIYAIRANLILPILIFFSLFKKSKEIKYLYISSILFLLGVLFLYSGGWILITPFLIVLLDQFIFEKKINFKNIKEYVPFIVVSIIFAVMLLPGFFRERIEGLQTLYYVDTETATPLINRIPFTIYMQFKTLAIPLGLSIYYEGRFISNLEYALMILVTFSVIFGIIYFLKKNRKISGLLLMIMVSILPSYSPVIIAWIAADRYQYMPSMFFSAILAISLLGINQKIEKNKIKEKNGKNIKFALYSTILIVSLYSIKTVSRNVELRNSKNLWIATKKTAPYSYRVYNNMGDVLAGEGDLDGALENFKRSVILKPDYADAVHNIGHIYLEKKDFELAKKYLEQSVNMNPRLYPSYYKLGFISYMENNMEDAKKYFETCLSIEPSSVDCARGIEMVQKQIN